MLRFRLNGWQQIGIVLSMLWAILAFSYAQLERSNQSKELSTADYRACTEAKEKSLDISDCLVKARIHYKLLNKGRSMDAPIVALVPIPVAWLLVYIVLWTVRWIRRGFQPST